MELQEKAWVINPVNLKEPHFVPDDVFYAETTGKAKQKALNHMYFDGFLTDDGEEVTYLSLRIKRKPSADKYLVGGEVKCLWQIELDRRTKERDDELDEMLREHPNAMAHIMKGGYYYRDNNCGYTEHKIAAGVYTIQEAVDRVKNTSLGDYRRVIPLDKEEHNAYLNKHIKAIQNRLI